jgi:sec-independent protein translocase protein TatA
MAGFGVPELLIILVIVIVLFGASRLAGIGSAMGSGIREFRKQVRDDEEPSTTTTTVTRTEEVSDPTRR